MVEVCKSVELRGEVLVKQPAAAVSLNLQIHTHTTYEEVVLYSLFFFVTPSAIGKGTTI